MTNHPNRSRTLTTSAAREAARALVSGVKGGRYWGIEFAESCLPRGWELSPGADDGDFFPLTVEHATSAFRSLARRRGVRA